MCGIAGFFGINKNLPNNYQIKKCLDLMHNRGPDAKGKIIKSFNNPSYKHLRFNYPDMKDLKKPK